MWFAKLTAPLSELYYSVQKQPPLYTKYSLYARLKRQFFKRQGKGAAEFQNTKADGNGQGYDSLA